MIHKFRAWDKETKTMNGMAEIYRNRNQEIELHPRDENIILMQSTGLKDKNDKEIFEGDIVQYQNSKVPSADSKGVIRFFDNWAMFGIDIEYNEPRALFFNGLADHISLEVVGNIYENPELIE